MCLLAPDALVLECPAAPASPRKATEENRVRAFRTVRQS